MRRPEYWIIGALVLVLVVKYAWPLFTFDMPMGYDVGFYRYLFLRHAEGIPPFWITDLPPWARGHPLGLFFFSTMLLRLGIPVDWLIGWVWNLFAVVLLCVLSWVSGKRYGRDVGLWTLVSCVLSVATFDGFAAMYWKTFASLLWCVLAFRALEKKSWLTIPFGILCVTTHHQTGLLFGLVLLSYCILSFNHLRPRDILLVAGGGGVILCIGLLAYLPIWNDAILQILPMLLGQTEAASGSFPPASFYQLYEGVVLFAGVMGFVLNMQRERWTVWQLAVLWSFLFIVAHLLFYRRFFLQFEFFLLPFAGIGFSAAWSHFRKKELRIAMIALLLLQFLLMWQAIVRNGPVVDAATFSGVLQVEAHVPSDAFVLALENDTPVILRGWYPLYRIGGPGLFDAPWGADAWQVFLLGSHEDRVRFLQQIQGPVFLFVSPFFHTYYGTYADAFLRDSCFAQVAETMLYRVTCIP